MKFLIKYIDEIQKNKCFNEVLDQIFQLHSKINVSMKFLIKYFNKAQIYNQIFSVYFI